MGDINSLPTAKRVESLLRICTKLQLIIDIYLEAFWGRSAVFEVIYSIVLLRKIGNEPVHNTQGYIRVSVDYGEHLLHILSAVFVIKPEDFMKKNVILSIIDTRSVGKRKLMPVKRWRCLFGRVMVGQHSCN